MNFRFDRGGQRGRRGKPSQQPRSLDQLAHIMVGRQRVGDDFGWHRRVARCDSHVPATRRTTGLRTQQEAIEFVRLHQCANTGNGARVAERREIQLDVGTFKSFARADEAAALVDAQRQRTTARHRVLQRGAEASAPGAECAIERRHARAIDVVDAQVILQVGADRGRMALDRDAERSEMRCVAESGELQQLGRVDCARGEDHFAVRVRGACNAALSVCNAVRTQAIEQDRRGMCVAFDREIGTLHDRPQIRARRRHSPAVAHRDLVQPDPFL